MKQIYLVSILLATFKVTIAQNIYINYDIDTNVFDVAKPLNLWIDFLETKDDSLGSQYWNAEEVEKYGHTSYFLVEYELNFMHPNYLEVLSHCDLKVLSIEETQEFYKITTLMEFAPRKNKSQVQYIRFPELFLRALSS